MVVMTFAAAAVPLLLEESGSPVADALETMLVKIPLAGAVTATVKFMLFPKGHAPRLVQTTWLPIRVAPGVLFDGTKIAPAGKLSVTERLEALPGPRLVTVIVYVKAQLAIIPGGPVTVEDMSARLAITVMLTVAMPELV